MNRDANPTSPPALLQAGPPGACPVHPRNNAIGRCRRCQQPFCEVCETRWQKETLCLACFTQILENKEATPGEMQAQKREGTTSLALAMLGWALFLGSFVMFWNICDGKGDKNAAIVNVVLFLASFIAPLLSLGLAAATLRSRGQSMTAATWGLVLAGLQIGTTFSLLVLNITHNW
jgi:hypothetical protein